MVLEIHPNHIEKYQIESADSGFIAGSKLEVFKPDIVILDIFLGDIDGRDFLKFIRNHPELSESKVIGMSGKLDKYEIKKLPESNHLTKTFIINQDWV